MEEWSYQGPIHGPTFSVIYDTFPDLRAKFQLDITFARIFYNSLLLLCQLPFKKRKIMVKE